MTLSPCSFSLTVDILDVNGLATAKFIMSVDSAFDSFNGSLDGDHRKPLKLAVSQDGPHIKFWKSMIEEMNSWEFIGKARVVRPPSQEGWLATMRAMICLWGSFQEKGFWYLNTKCFNQDPLENFFYVIRQNCGSNHHPNAQQFQDALKTAIINNLPSNQGKGNTKDDGCSLLTDLTSLFQIPE